jgi:hypothetical protein
MKHSHELPIEPGDAKARSQGLAISPSLIQREEFLRRFVLTGDLERDMAVFLTGTGQDQVFAASRQHDFSLLELAATIRHNHQDELANLKQGRRPLWSQKYQRWAPNMKAYYAHVLDLECSILDSILMRDSGLSSRSAA